MREKGLMQNVLVKNLFFYELNVCFIVENDKRFLFLTLNKGNMFMLAAYFFFGHKLKQIFTATNIMNFFQFKIKKFVLN